jgi:hypothetical protein
VSVRLKRAARALRALYGVALGVQEAPAGYACTVKIPHEEVTEDYGGVSLITGDAFCADAAKVVVDTTGFCEAHWEARTRRARN